MVDLDGTLLSFQQLNCTRPCFYLEQTFVLLKGFSFDERKMSHNIPLYMKHCGVTDSPDVGEHAPNPNPGKITSSFQYFFFGKMKYKNDHSH